ncbi:hypothetical protein MPTK1_2g12620 [Marchantia polymorpha subsp. ruderalis]|uniref:Yippee domain-containing protein n=1 Tax=Marchantia polymorpha TaxID=3197 RepID=A0A2R6XAW0_MARPO|nr:hypothetical protein MARPO_0026s0109 [Marchantia polymorpha]BBN02083.1 hypothetical protein Mp_2g12620 [Marchantia polymorpha subsp. ruderalis]|eukprot:PTQ43237.1 hypothetical protein MARPO_0026s0109 [Marchantia polymorpha]
MSLRYDSSSSAAKRDGAEWGYGRGHCASRASSAEKGRSLEGARGEELAHCSSSASMLFLGPRGREGGREGGRIMYPTRTDDIVSWKHGCIDVYCSHCAKSVGRNLLSTCTDRTLLIKIITLSSTQYLLTRFARRGDKCAASSGLRLQETRISPIPPRNQEFLHFTRLRRIRFFLPTFCQMLGNSEFKHELELGIGTTLLSLESVNCHSSQRLLSPEHKHRHRSFIRNRSWDTLYFSHRPVLELWKLIEPAVLDACSTN